MPTRSSGSPMRDSGIPFTMSATISCGVMVRLASVSIGPGAMAFIRMFMPPSSRGQLLGQAVTPTLARP